MSTVLVRAIRMPIRCSGVPTLENVKHDDIDEKYVVYKGYKCFRGHDFTLAFSSPMNLSCYWECPECGIVAPES